MLNLSLIWMPLTIWMPVTVYESSHHTHHSNELTRPGTDPESWYIAEHQWQEMHPVGRALYQFNNSFAGRMIVGPWISVYRCWKQVISDLLSGSGFIAITLHIAGVAGVLAWVSVIADMPLYIYLFIFVWPGISISLIRSFLEHRYHSDPASRTAIVKGCWITRLLFLNNNYHCVHHEQPNLPWYQIPGEYRKAESSILNRNDDFYFDGYLSIAKQYFLKPWTLPVYPEQVLARAEAVNSDNTALTGH